MISGYSFKSGTSRLRLCIPAAEAELFSVFSNSQEAQKRKVYTWPAWVYDDPVQGTQGQVTVLVESPKREKFAETLAYFFKKYPEHVQKDLLVHRIRGKELSPSTFHIEVAPTQETLFLDQHVLASLNTAMLREIVYATLREREARYIEFMHKHDYRVLYDRVDFTFS